ncbi:hypothetical protein M758_8G001000 [Ceratodon purpureus]|nr:hypothetical protein M758_8G001000 [Ceratodon purpureus]
MGRRIGRDPVSYDRLPRICECSEFCCEEDCQGTEPSSELIKTRNAYSTRNLHFEVEEEPDEEWLLLSSYTKDRKVCSEQCKPKPIKSSKGRRKLPKRRANKVRDEEWKPELAKGWKMPKKRVKTVWAKSGRCQILLKASMRFLANCPLLLLKTMRDAYVRAMTRMESKRDRRMWNVAGARILQAKLLEALLK